MCDAFIEAASSELGIPTHADYNRGQLTGAGYYQRWIHQGRRISAATAFLTPAKATGRLEVKTHAHVTKILFEGKRAVGVEFQRERGGPVQRVTVRRELVLSAGAGNTPKILQLSGVGPADFLQQMGVRVVHAMAYAFTKSRPDVALDDLQFHFSPGSYASGVAGKLDDFPGMTLGYYQLRPTSVGNVRLRSLDPFELPAVQPNYLQSEQDRRVAIDALRLARRILHSAPFQKYIERDEFPPSSATTDDELLDCARQRGTTSWHFIGSCSMGKVVDAELRVHGLDGLRVVDASVMPTMPSGNTGAPTMMIAEKAADMMLGRSPLPVA